MTDIVKLVTEYDIHGNEISAEPDVKREALVTPLFEQLKTISLEEFVSYLTNKFEAVIDYANLCAGEKTGQRISLNFNPHRLNVDAHSGAALYDALKKESFIKGLSRVIVLNKKKGNTKDLLYASIGMGVEGTVYIQEFPPHVARDFAYEYQLSRVSRVLDPCAGWGGRMLGFSVVVDDYVCCEPSTRTAAGLRGIEQFIKTFRSDFNAQIHEACFEDVVLPDNYFDFALTSPPYYDTENYAPGEQSNSGNRYASFNQWVEGFYAPLIHRTMAALKPGASFVLNIGSRVYPLNTTLFKIAEGKYGVEKQRGKLSASSGLGKSGEGETFYEVRKSGSAAIIISTGDAPTEIGTGRSEEIAKEEPSALQALIDSLSDDDFEPSEESSAASEPLTASPEQRSSASKTKSSTASLADFLALSDDLPTVTVAPQKATSSASLSAFLAHAPDENVNWRAQEPPDLSSIDQIVLNVETNGLDWARGDKPIGITVGTLDGKMKRFLPFAFNGGGNLDEAVVKRWAHEQLKNKHITNTHTSFDVHMMRVWGVDLEEQHNTVSDIQHYAALLDDHRRRFSLDVLATDFLGGIEIPKLDESDMQHYAANEVAARAEYQVQLVAEIRNEMWPMLDEQDLHRVRQLEDDVIYPVCEMEKNGAQIDVELLDRFSVECMQEHHRLLREVSDECGFNFDLSTQSWQRLFEKYDLPLKHLASGTASFAENVVSKIEHPVVQKAHLADQYTTLNSKTFAAYKKLIDKDGVLRFDINQLRGDEGGTVSGRFSIGYVQQVPNKDNHTKVFGDNLFPRKLFVARTGSVLAADAAQIEYRIFAHFANNPKVLAAYRQDPKTSFHRLLHSMIKVYKPDMLYTDQKSLNFMKMYAGGLIKIAVMMGHITAEEGEEIRRSRTMKTDPRLERAREINDIYAREMPEVADLTNKATHTAKSKCDDYCRQWDGLHKSKIPHRGFVRTMTGRRSRFPNDYKTYIALNRIIQGTAADYNKKKIVELHRTRKETGFLMRLTVHDEVMGDAQTSETAQKVDAVLNEQSFPDLKVPILWETSTGASWADCK